jgi:hypothetical protein
MEAPAECQVKELAHGLQYANRVVAVAHGLFNFGRLLVFQHPIGGTELAHKRLEAANRISSFSRSHTDLPECRIPGVWVAVMKGGFFPNKKARA